MMNWLLDNIVQCQKLYIVYYNIISLSFLVKFTLVKVTELRYDNLVVFHSFKWRLSYMCKLHAQFDEPDRMKSFASLNDLNEH